MPVLRYPRVAAAIAALVSGFAGAADAQGVVQSGSIVGVVRDSTGGRLSKAMLILLDSALQFPRAESNDSGAFALLGIPAGSHRVTARRIGNLPETLTVVVSAAVAARVD